MDDINNTLAACTVISDRAPAVAVSTIHKLRYSSIWSFPKSDPCNYKKTQSNSVKNAHYSSIMRTLLHSYDLLRNLSSHLDDSYESDLPTTKGLRNF
jgi:hypothetical protein